MKKNKVLIFTLIFSAVNLIIPIIYLIKCKMNSYIISDVLVIIPIVSFLLSMLFIAIKKIPNIVKLLLSVIIFFFSSFSCYWLNGVGGNIEFRAYVGLDEVNNYNQTVIENQNFLFDRRVETEKYGNFEDISTYKYHSTGIFQQLAFTTIVKYNYENFQEAKNKIDLLHTFYKEPVEEGEPVPVFSFEGFDFRVEKSKNATEWNPKQLNLIGINVKSCEIAYVYFEDFDLDVVSDFNDILDYYCGWRYVIEERNS